MFAPILSILLASSVLATPTTSSPKIAGCSASKKTLSMPSGQTQLVVPNTTTPTFIGIGVGVQNYTCDSTGTFTNVGAVAELFDISCADESVYGALTDITSAIWQAAPKSVTTQDIIKTLSIIDPVFDTPFILGQHFFVTNPTTGVGLSPEWNFASASLAGHSDAFVIGAKVGDITSPTSPSDIDWLMLNKAEGDLASQIFRVETRGGQPPASCTPGSPEIEVKYVSQYWLFGGSFTH
ncbi:hypothetical protein EUX98_g5217 [Antrodiella citrinella]|uniref:Malate dehydrogenase n=1 Tax=Antrodiella citrinella TaxID=2447956 RepID=A0A4S4MS08_9APHY|nr:hypothetical protein EUX98_g5217 [Antrodiella citrinella]